jgi:molybdopterin converting factor small subunit
MRITVHYLAQIKRAAGVAGESVEMPAGTLAELLDQLGRQHGETFRSMLAQKGLLFFVNDEQAEPGRALRDGDELVILAPMAGG